MKVILTGDGTKKIVTDAVADMSRWIAGAADLVATDLDCSADLSDLEADLIVAFGGDGFILDVARRLKGRRTPVAGLNFGRLGFLACFDPSSARESLSPVLSGSIEVSARKMLEVRRGCGSGAPLFALNDVVISRGSNPRIIRIDLDLDGERILRYSGDGLIVSTPTGSTAYSLAAGGPILMPGSQGLVLTPICPQASSARPLVVPASSRIVVELDSGPGGAVLAVDGQETVPMSSGEAFEVKTSDREFLLVANPLRSFLELLRDKLNWGDLPLLRFQQGSSSEECKP